MQKIFVLFTLKYQIEVHVRTINFWLLFRPVRAYSILYVYYFSKFSHNCKIFFYVIYNVSGKIQVFFKSKGENDHENEKNTHIFLVYKKILDLNNLGHFAPVRLFHPAVRLLVFRKYATLYGYSILYLYSILKSIGRIVLMQNWNNLTLESVLVLLLFFTKFESASSSQIVPIFAVK